MATTKGSQRERIENLKKKIRRDAEDTLRELDALQLDQAAGGSGPPGQDDGSGGGPGEEP
jgi:hypothetical protein